eukprot:7036901-Pyramimonas_sp.AAC.2
MRLPLEELTKLLPEILHALLVCAEDTKNRFRMKRNCSVTITARAAHVRRGHQEPLPHEETQDVWTLFAGAHGDRAAAAAVRGGGGGGRHARRPRETAHPHPQDQGEGACESTLSERESTSLGSDEGASLTHPRASEQVRGGRRGVLHLTELPPLCVNPPPLSVNPPPPCVNPPPLSVNPSPLCANQPPLS